MNPSDNNKDDSTRVVSSKSNSVFVDEMRREKIGLFFSQRLKNDNQSTKKQQQNDGNLM